MDQKLVLYMTTIFPPWLLSAAAAATTGAFFLLLLSKCSFSNPEAADGLLHTTIRDGLIGKCLKKKEKKRQAL